MPIKNSVSSFFYLCSSIVLQGRRRWSGMSGECRTTFLAEYASRRLPFLASAYFTLCLPLILFNLSQFIDAIINNACCVCHQ